MIRYLRLCAILCVGIYACAQEQTASAGGKAEVARAVGTIKNVTGDTVTLRPDSGAEMTATLTGSTKILRVPPGEKDLKNATPLQAQDLQPGDRVLVRGQASADGHSISALAVIVMKQADVSARQARDRDDWQKRGIGGLVSAVDNGTITVSVSGFGGNHNLMIHTTKDTIARRYAAGSVKFDEAKPAPLDQIKIGDQLRARGTKSADGNELTAEEVVSGTFRNIAGTITAVDHTSNSITVQDAIAKNSVVVKFTSDSQMKKLPAEMAQRIALRLKGGAGQGADGNGGEGNRGSEGPAGGFPRGQGGTQAGGSQGTGGAPDLQRFLSRLPDSKLSDLQKGETVMIVSTAGADGEVTAITLLAGVEPILTASPNRGAAILSPWSLAGSNAEAESAQ